MAAKAKKTDAEKVLDALLGTIADAKEKISDAIDDLIEKAEEKARQVKEKFETEECEEEEKEEKPNILTEQLEKAAKSLGIVTKKQMDEIEEKIDKLLAKEVRKRRK